MGNLSYLIPTKNKKDFNREKIFSLILENFKNISITNLVVWNSIQIHKDDYLVTDIYFDQDCDIINFDEDIEFLQSNESGLTDEMKFNLVSWLYKLKELNTPKNSNKWNGLSLQMTYGVVNDIKNDIEFFLRDYFGAYIFDDGIHPEFMPPDYVRKSFPKPVSNFKTFLKRFLN